MPGSPIDPGFAFASITPSDTAPISYDGDVMACRGIYVGVSGDLAVKNSAGDSVTYTGLAAGIVHPITTGYILSTGTTATNIVAIF